MLERVIIQNLVKYLRIAPEHVAREAYEMLILQALGESILVKKIVLKGGTALRLAYASPRFSEDLDFSLLSEISVKDLKKTLEELCQHFSEIKIADISSKRYTYFALLKIKEKFLPQAFSIKIEISKRKAQLLNERDYKLTLLESPTTPLTVFINVLNPKTIFKNKIEAVRTRVKPRDLFDLWFLSEKLKKPLPLKIKGFKKTIIKQELNKFLSQKYHHIVEMLIQKYANNHHPAKTKRN